MSKEDQRMKKLMITRKMRGFVTVLFLVITASSVFVGAKPALAGPPMPDGLILGTHEIGTTGYRLVSMVAEGIIEKYPGLQVRAIPAGVDTSRSYMARLGDSHCTIHNEQATFFLQEGLRAYSSLAWGPQLIRYLWIAQNPGMAFAVRGDSDIRSFADLKGKTVATFPGSPAPTIINEAMLAFGGLTWDDVVPKEYTSPGTAYRAVINGKLDTSFFGVTSGLAYEGAALPCGWRYLEMPPEDKEGWARVKKVVPAYAPKLCTVGGGISPENPKHLMTGSYPAFVAWERLDEDIAYWITKAVHESYDIYKKKHKALENEWTKEKHWKCWEADVIPLHNGSIRYFKEIGDWTPEREKTNIDRLNRQTRLKALWKSVVDEALAKKIKSRDFPAFWMKKRAEAGF